MLQHYTRYVWVVLLALFTIVYGLGGQHGASVVPSHFILPRITSTRNISCVMLSITCNLILRLRLPFIHPLLLFRIPYLASSSHGGPTRPPSRSRHINIRRDYLLVVLCVGAHVHCPLIAKKSSFFTFTIRAADFNCRLPANTSPTKIVILTLIGLMLPVVYIASLGSLLMTVPAYAEAYVTGDAAEVLHKGGVYCSWPKSG